MSRRWEGAKVIAATCLFAGLFFTAFGIVHVRDSEWFAAHICFFIAASYLHLANEHGRR